MARTKLNKFTLLSFLIAFGLFLLPFFWFKPGEMDLGGDSSRLYFYDPLAYLTNYALYSISPSAFGAENIGFFMVPFVYALYLLKQILISPTLLVAIFHGMSFAVAFLSIYGITKNLLNTEYKLHSNICELVGIIAGLFYVLSPLSINGWDKVLVIHNQFFLNPLAFYLILRYFITSNYVYIIVFLITTFIFSPNFSFAAAPAFFAFYPLSLVFMFIYRLVILKKKIIWKHIFISCIILILLQMFHIFPQMVSLLSPGSVLNTTVFTEAGKIDRGLSYFSAIVPSIKTSVNFLSLLQVPNFEIYHYAFFIFPISILIGLCLNKSKTMILTAAIFLIVLFFSSANITDIGLAFYKYLFNIPGFSMFRNFYGQWLYALLFFYTILFALALAIIYEKINELHKYILSSVIVLVLIISSIPFINGSLMNKELWQTKNIKIFMKMDPNYEEALEFVRSLPADGKVVTLPLTDPGYQIVMGINGGAYQGPSTISYLTGKKDFSGYNEFGSYQDIFEDFIAAKNYEGLKNLFVLLNIKYIFYNSDPGVYEKNFPGFPYEEARKFLPKDQQKYKELLSKIGVHKIKQFNDIIIYEVKGNKKNSEIFIPDTIIPTERSVTSWDAYLNNYDTSNNLYAFIPAVALNKESSIIELDQIAQNDLIVKDFPIEVIYPYSRWKISSPFYFFVTHKEKKDLEKAITAEEKINLQLVFAAKRISELDNWGHELNRQDWDKQFDRYRISMDSAIDIFSKQKDTFDIKTKIILDNRLHQAIDVHANKFNVIIERHPREKEYLNKAAERIFNNLENKLGNLKESKKGILYVIQNSNSKGDYNLKAIYKSNKSEIYENSSVSLGDNIFPLQSIDEKKKELFYGTVSIAPNEKLVRLNLNENIVDDTKNWFETEGIVNTKKEISNSGELLLRNDNINLVKRINNWEPQSTYVVSFDYNTHGKSVEFSIFTQNIRSKIDTKDPPPTAIFRESKNARQTIKFTAIVDSALTNKGWVVVRGLDQAGAKVDIKNFKVVKTEKAPELKFETKDNSKVEITVPEYKIKRINPAKYEVTVTSTNKPYYLALTNAFNSNWEVFLFDQTHSRNIFTDMFSTYGKNPIAQEKHVAVNGFANGWYIEPSDVNNKKTYTLIIEHKTQKIFYIGLVISLTIFLALLFYLAYRLIRHEK